MAHEPLTAAQLEQSQDWADRNTAPYPLGWYLETIREAQARIEALEKALTEIHASAVCRDHMAWWPTVRDTDVLRQSIAAGRALAALDKEARDAD